jgi:nitrate/nitrite transporter NarK
MLAIMLFLAMILNFIFGWISDKIGRKPIIMLGCLLATFVIYPVYMSFTHFGNPELEKAMHESPVFVIADPNDCSFALIPSELKSHIKFKSSCDLLKNLLNQYSVSYKNDKAREGMVARAIIGKYNVTSVDISEMTVRLGFFNKNFQ